MKDKNRFALAAVNNAARKAGLTPGLALADARARIPSLDVAQADEAADAKLLDSVGAWAERFTPVVVLDPPDGLFLDIAGSAHLFGGDAKLRAQIEWRLHAQGLHARIAIAETPGAAWALARYAQDTSSAGKDLPAALGPLPIAALRLDAKAEDFLLRLGLRRIEQIVNAPRNSFTARAGERALLRLDQALGRAREALNPRRPPAPIFSDRRFLEPLVSETAILIALENAVAEIDGVLETLGAGATRFALDVFPVSGESKRVSIALSRPARDASLLLRLFREKFNALTGPLCDEFGIEAIRLSALELTRLEERADAWIETQDVARDMHPLVDAVSARLGADAALRPEARAEHLPEAAGALTPSGFSHSEKTTSPACGGGNAPRPLRLFSPAQPIEAIAGVPDGAPERFRWRRVLRRVVRAEGPERIVPPWFVRTGATPTRDYFRVEDDQGRRYWLYREGLYDEVETPRWFVHGLFA